MAINLLHNQQTKASQRIKTIKKFLKSAIHLHNPMFDGTYFNFKTVKMKPH